jgi:hypothetical protein
MQKTFIVPVVSPSGSTPAWAAGLSSYQVRNLIGSTYGPTNGKHCIADPTAGTTGNGVVPGEWNQPYQSWGREAIINAWCGGAGDTVGKRLFVHGGGHNDGANNGLYVYEFGSGSRPVGWRLAGTAYPSSGCSLSALSTVFNGSSFYGGSATVLSDNRPSSIHSYNQTIFNSAQQRFYRFGGAPYLTSGGPTTAAYYFGMSAETWNSVGSSGAAWATVPGKIDATLFTSPDESKTAFVSASTPMRIYTMSDGSYVVLSNQAPFGGEDVGPSAAAGARSTTADKWVTVSGDGVYEWTVNWTTNTITYQQKTHASHTTFLPTNSKAGSLVYDASHSGGPCYWMFGFRRHQGTTLSTQLLRMDATTFAVTAPSPMTGDAIASSSGSLGSYSRHVWFPAWRVIATVQAATAPISIIKVPN